MHLLSPTQRAGRVDQSARGNSASLIATFIRFHARIAITGVNPYVPVSPALASRIEPGWRKPIPVLVHLNDGAET